jgi:hypothetical protein
MRLHHIPSLIIILLCIQGILGKPFLDINSATAVHLETLKQSNPELVEYTTYHAIDSENKITNLADDVLEGGVAYAAFSNSLNTNGWTYMTIYTSGAYSDNEQFYAAGYLEGYLTQSLIWDALPLF